jgi:hypothetical protein
MFDGHKYTIYFQWSFGSSCLIKSMSSIWNEVYMHGIISFISHEENFNLLLC